MERTMPERLRAYADALEDTRRMDNVESLRRIPSLDQQMLLALNGASKDYRNGFPDEGYAIRALKERLISVSTSREQGVVLGLFYTNADPYMQGPRVEVGIFPMYGEEVKYNIRPTDVLSVSQSDITIRLETDRETDPFEALSSIIGPNLLFFEKSPFDAEKPYQVPPSRVELGYPYPTPEQIPLRLRALEDNVIIQALWDFNEGREPHIFKKPGFNSFIKSHRDDPKYIELYKAFTQVEL